MSSVREAEADGRGDGGGEVDRPVFYDDSGVRVVAVQWTVRATCLLGVLLCLAVAATLGTHVSLPRLDQLHPIVVLSQEADGSQSAIEPLPTRIVNEDARRTGSRGRARVVGSTPSKTGSETAQVPDTAPRVQDAVPAQPGLRGRGHEDGSIANQSTALGRSENLSIHPARRASTARSMQDTQARNRPSEATGIVKAPKQKASPANPNNDAR